MFSRPERDLSCPICHEIFKEPVLVSCSHSFCKECLQSWWAEKQIHQCPVCAEISLAGDPPINRALKNLCETFIRDRHQHDSTKSEPLCSQHSEKLKLFCEDDQQPVCFVCRDSSKHNNHKFKPTDEAAQNHREELRGSLKPLQEKLTFFLKVKRNCDQTADHIQNRGRIAASQIKEQFKVLHQFLEEEEEVRISALKEEVRQKSERMKEKIEALNRDIAALSDTISATEEELKANDVSFLQGYEITMRTIQQCLQPEDPELLSGALIDEAKHLGNLSFNIWINMRKKIKYFPVILEPNSAHPDLILSKDLTSVEFKTQQELPDNPERFDFSECVLGSKGFDSGTHSWDVEVKDNKHWSVGVVMESAQTKGKMASGYWALSHSEEIYRRSSASQKETVLSVKMKPQRIRVQLEYERGKLFFSDAETNTVIHTFTGYFTERLFPFLRTLDEVSLKISPVKIKVLVEHPRMPSGQGSWLGGDRL